jgi:hypothetical protein
MCVCRGGRLDVAGWLTREDRVRWLQEYQRDLQQQGYGRCSSHGLFHGHQAGAQDLSR